MKIGIECGQSVFRPSSWTKMVDHPYKTILVRNGLESYFKPVQRRRLDIKPRKFMGGFAIGPVMFWRTK